MMGYALFLVFVALAVYIQNLTGFALALVLLGLVGATDLFLLPDVVNVVSVIALVNAAVFLHRRGAMRLDRLLWPALACSAVGIVIGLATLDWLVGSAYEVLRLLLGISIVACAWMLWRRAAALAQTSRPAAFMSVGLISGVMSGLFAAGGPPLVYQIYRQPWTLARQQESLIFFFGMNAILRLGIVVPTGSFNAQSLTLAAIAVPVVFLVTALTARRPSPLPAKVLKRFVCGLLVVTGLAMVHTSLSHLL